MAALVCIEKNLDALKGQYKDGELFSARLRKSVFLTLLEIFWNLSLAKKEFMKCFSKKTLKKLKKHKSILRRILDKSTPLKKRWSLFLHAASSFKRLIEKQVLKEFFANCVE